MQASEPSPQFTSSSASFLSLSALLLWRVFFLWPNPTNFHLNRTIPRPICLRSRPPIIMRTMTLDPSTFNLFPSSLVYSYFTKFIYPISISVLKIGGWTVTWAELQCLLSRWCPWLSNRFVPRQLVPHSSFLSLSLYFAIVCCFVILINKISEELVFHAMANYSSEPRPPYISIVSFLFL